MSSPAFLYSAWPTGLSMPSGKRYGLKRTPTKPSACSRSSSAAAAAGASVGLAKHMPRYSSGCALKAAVTYEWSYRWLAGCTISAPATPDACAEAASASYVAALVSSSGGAAAHGYGGWPLDHTCTALSITLHVCSVLLRAAGADASVATSTRRVRSIVVSRVPGGTQGIEVDGGFPPNPNPYEYVFKNAHSLRELLPKTCWHPPPNPSHASPCTPSWRPWPPHR